MWCKSCKLEVEGEICSYCGSETIKEIPVEVYWCSTCKTPIIRRVNEPDKGSCPICKGRTKYLATDIRPVFPEERLLLEVLLEKPFAFEKDSIWASGSRYYVDGKSVSVGTKEYERADISRIIHDMGRYGANNSYTAFESHIATFIDANWERLNYLKDEAYSFIRETSADYSPERTVISFSGGKDSTVVADLVVRALGNCHIVHIFGDTTLEFPLTYEYVRRFRLNNPHIILKTSKNKDQDFYEVCSDIGPPSRVMRWCCTMFKTGPITKVINNLYRDQSILTYYGIRKNESTSRSKYNRVEDSAESIKIQKQKVASPVFEWIDLDIWLYILAEKIDFNDAYRLGYDRVGCWCCPNNSGRSMFLSKIYMKDEAAKWRDFLVDFARSIGKPDAEVYVDTGKWKARQGGNGVSAASDIRVVSRNCTAEENARIYEINEVIDDRFYELFFPLGKVSKELGRKLIKEVLVLDSKSNVPIISIQPAASEIGYAVKIKTMNVSNHDDLHRMVQYQIRKYNACRQCLKCASLCKYGAITISGGIYSISDEKCKRCRMCVSSKYLDGGCLMNKYLFTKE